MLREIRNIIRSNIDVEKVLLHIKVIQIPIRNLNRVVFFFWIV